MEGRGRKPDELTGRLDTELRPCQEIVHNIVNRSVDAILIVDRKGRIRFANPAAADLFSRAAGELVGQNFGFPVSGGERTEIEVLCKNLLPTVAEMRVADTEWEGERAWLATLRDVTERKHLEERLKAALETSEETLAEIDSIIRSISEGLIVTDGGGHIRLINHALEIMLGASCREVAGLPVDSLFTDTQVREKIHDSLQEGETARFDFELKTDGRSQPVRTISARTSPVLDPRQHRIGMVTILQDVTREREIERMKSEFVSFAAHELRSPLTAIIGFAEMLLLGENLNPEEKRSYAEIIKRQGMFLADIVSTFLDLSLIESGRGIVLKKRPCTVEELFGLLDTVLLAQADPHRFQVVSEDRSVLLNIDLQRIKQVLGNLVGNAVKYSPAGSSVRVEGAAEGDWYRISVRDQGIGMTPQQVEKVFDKFYRADSSSTSPAGIGLGMSIVKSIVELHGGRMSIQSSPGGGTTVSFFLPIGVAQEARPA